MRLPEVLDKGLDKADVIALQALLDVVADVPASLSLRVLLALRVAYGKAFALGDFQHRRAVALGAAAVTVKDQDQRRGRTGPFRDIEPIGTDFALVFHRVADGFRRPGVDDETKEND